MIIHSIFRDYSASFYSDFTFLNEIKAIPNKYFVVDKKVYDLYREELDPLLDSLVYFVDANEESKTEVTAFKIIDQLIKLPTKRNTNLIVIGGGIVQDISCFLSSILYRGISWFFVPTTLLAQTDSCIGSKSSINYLDYKNLIGTFYPPSKIFISSAFLGTLSQKDYLSGVGEMMKCALMDGKNAFNETSSHIDGLLNRDHSTVLFEIKKALSFKKKVIEIDEFDKNYRNIMNYGHTFGHAIESTSHFQVPHGQAIAIGLLIANEISVKRGLLKTDYNKEIRLAVARILSKELLKNEYLSNNVIEKMKKDKKFLGTFHSCILLSDTEIKKYNDVTDSEVADSLEKIRNDFCED
ncbi:MAG: 3-dehydroquinate synthase [Bacilli bacterium]